MLNENEDVLWEGAPEFWPFLGNSLFTVPIGIVFLVASFFIFSAFSASFGMFQSFGIEGFGLPLFSLIPVFFVAVALVIIIGPPAYTAMSHKNMHYAITDKRILIQKGVVGRDFDILDFDKISNAEVNVGFFDKLFGKGTGSIFITMPGSLMVVNSTAVPMAHVLSNVKNPYEVFKFFKKVSYDVKTDIEFPNKYRPGTNPGYGTKYEGAGFQKSK